MALTRETRIGVLGAGAMGSGIATVAAAAGHSVVLADTTAPALERARAAIRKSLARDVQKQRRSETDAGAIEGRIVLVHVDDDLREFRGCGLAIEAIVEDLEIKRRVFRSLDDATAGDCVLASNTSSLAVGALSAACTHPGRVIGLHFFNPATVMPLVEVVGAITSDESVLADARALIDAWGKTTVRASDTPGFIVNRVARPFYGESLRLLEEGIADIPTIDWAMKEIGGFRMGPFELMDMIGNDVNYAVTQSVFEAFYFDPRYRPSLTQRRMVEAGRLGRKSGSGYYDYGNKTTQPEPTTDRALGARVVDRVVAMLINEAVDAVHLRVASPHDIDLAMTKGVNYPRGLLSWGDEIGPATVLARMTALQDEYGEDRYRPSPLLRRVARDGGRFAL